MLRSIVQRFFSKRKLNDAFRLLNPTINDHSWFGRSGNGYRFDHFFVSGDIKPKILSCNYIHQPRINKLSDHSIMLMKIAKY